MKGRPPGNFNPRITNRKATHDYFISHKIECGMALLGSEVKSLRLGRAQLAESFARVDRGELILHGMHIDPYEKAHLGHDPLRERKLLVHKREANKLAAAIQREGMTLIPLRLYFNPKGIAKIELGIAKGKKLHDKRETDKKRSWDREKSRLMRDKG